MARSDYYQYLFSEARHMKETDVGKSIARDNARLVRSYVRSTGFVRKKHSPLANRGRSRLKRLSVKQENLPRNPAGRKPIPWYGYKGSGKTLQQAVFRGASTRVQGYGKNAKANQTGRALVQAHLDYIEYEDIEDKQVKRGRMFGSVQRDEILKEDPRQEVIHRFILSPEEGYRVDMDEYTRLYMQSLSSYVGGTLDWVAVSHHDTDTDHSHVILKGVTKEGEKIFFPRSFYTRVGREIAKSVMQAMVGNRIETTEYRKNELGVGKEGISPHDYLIRNELDDGLFINPNILRHTPEHKKPYLVRRLKRLVKLGVAEKVDMDHQGYRESCYRMRRTDWFEQLQLYYRKRFVQRAKRTILYGDDIFVPDVKSGSEPIEGRVAGMGFIDEMGVK
jgi:hypothetical protein